MKIKAIAFALASAFALTACGSEAETDDQTLEGVIGGSASQQQSLAPGEDVDCQSIHSALLDHGIDPALLTPEVVLEACIDSADASDEMCHEVAYGCFGPQDDCEDGHDDSDDEDPNDEPTDDFCQLVYDEAAQLGLEVDNISPDEAFQHCLDQGYEQDICHEVSECLDGDGMGDPADDDDTDDQDGQSDICEAVYDFAGQAGANDPDGLSAEEAWQLCVDAGFSDSDCQSIIDQCYGGDANDGSDPSGDDETDEDGMGNGGDADDTNPDGSSSDDDFCQAVEDAVGDQNVPEDATEDELMQACLDEGYDDVTCDEIVNCLTN